MADCLHEVFDCNVAVNRMPDVENGPIKRYSADVHIVCDQCKTPFRFIGLPVGVDLNGAAVSVDGTEARLAIAPKGAVLTPLDPGQLGGFTIRRTV